MGVHARHFGSFAANQRAASLQAPVGDASDHAFCYAVFQFAGGEVVEEEQRLCALDDQIVHAHGDKIDADRVMAIRIDRQLQFRTDAVVSSDKQRIFVARRLGIEEPAESTDLAIGARTHGCLDQRANCLD